MIKKLALSSFALLMSGAAAASSGHATTPTYDADVSNLPSVQRGAKTFMNYCAGCHSMQFMRYSRIAQDLEIPEDLLKTNLMFTSEKTGDVILTALPKAEAAKWFGTAPPDLTLETRARGEGWVYGYLTGFYVDSKRPLGVNNLVLPGASMPHVLWELQGWQKQVLKEEKYVADDGKETVKLVHDRFEPLTEGKLSHDDYHKFVGDLVNFMAYAAEPGRSHRQALGGKIIVYLLILLGFAYLLKKEYWKDVH